MKFKEIEVIHESLVNGQRKQMVDQIDRYGNYDFWADYSEYLKGLCITNYNSAFYWLADAVKSYFRIKNR